MSKPHMNDKDGLGDENWTEGVSIVVPTYKRGDQLLTALNSLITQSALGHRLEIVIADNDPLASAKERVAHYTHHLDPALNIEIIYAHAPNPGVANARNVAMATARGRYIAFLDDDMAAGGNWLSTLLSITKDLGAAIAFLGITARMPDDTPLSTHMAPYFSRFGPEDMDGGLIDIYYGCGGSMLDRLRADLPDPIFNPALNEIGGEDDHLFEHIVRNGGKIAWSSKAISYEDVPAHRATVSYLKKRNFAFGQAPSQTSVDHKNWIALIKWMIIGSLQWSIFGVISIILKLLRRPNYVTYMAKSAQGAGKVLWMNRFAPKLYAQA